MDKQMKILLGLIITVVAALFIIYFSVSYVMIKKASESCPDGIGHCIGSFIGDVKKGIKEAEDK